MSSVPRGDSDRQSPNEPKQRDITIIRGKHDSDNPYFVASRASAQDEQLTYDARGLLFYLLSKPDDWVIRIDDLRRAGCGRDKVYRIIDELVKAGYMTPRSKRQDDKGRWIWTPHRLYERPYPENPYTDCPYTENTEIKALSSESLSTENKKESSATNISVPSDTPITSPLSDGENTVAAQDASHNEVSAADSTDTTPVKEAVAVKGSTRSSKRKEKAIVHPDAAAAAEPSPYYKPSADERNAMFEAVCAHVFGVTDRDSIREMARGDHSRAGKIVSWLLRQNDAFAPNGSGKKVVVGLISAPAQPQHVAQFAAAYKAKHRDASLPIDIVKFTDAWRAWASQQQRKQQAQQRQQAENAQRTADAAKPRATPEELAALKAEFGLVKSQLAEGKDA